MLAKGTRITTHANGTTVPIEALVPGDLVYSPMTNSLHEIVDIKSRTAEFGPEGSDENSELLRPVRLRRGSLSGARPLEDLITSPAQQLFVVRKSDNGPAALELEASSEQMVHGKARFEDCTSVLYYAIFTKSACAICANEALVRSYSSTWVEARLEEAASFRAARRQAIHRPVQHAAL